MDKNMDQEKRLAEIAGNPDETQIVSLKDLEELEYLQLTGKDRKLPEKSRRSISLSMILGLVAALGLAAMLAVMLMPHGARPAASQAGQQGSR